MSDESNGKTVPQPARLPIPTRLELIERRLDKEVLTVDWLVKAAGAAISFLVLLVIALASAIVKFAFFP